MKKTTLLFQLIQTFPNHPYCYAITAETFITSLKVEGWFSPVLKVDWPTIVVVYWPNSTEMKTKMCIRINPFLARRIRRIIAGTF